MSPLFFPYPANKPAANKFRANIQVNNIPITVILLLIY